MFSIKRIFIFIIAAVIALSTASAQTRDEATIEWYYLQEAIELMIINESARASSRESKMISLEYIGEALDRGSRNDEIRQTLEFLSLEGTRNIARENNRVINNFPEVRRQAARYLGIHGTEEARVSLIEVLKFEREPMVLQEAIKSLGDIGTNDNNDTVTNIVWFFSRYDNLNPDNLMAIATIDALEKIARKNGGIHDPEAIRLLIRISEGHYIAPVRERARQLVAELRTYSR